MDSFYDVDGLEELATEIGVALRDTLKYLVACVVDGANPEDAAKLTPELLEAFESVKDNCEEFISTYYFQTSKLELYNEAVKSGEWDSIKDDMKNYTKFTCKVAHLAAEKQGKL